VFYKKYYFLSVFLRRAAIASLLIKRLDSAGLRVKKKEA
jgi:hypothetical protein